MKFMTKSGSAYELTPEGLFYNGRPAAGTYVGTVPQSNYDYDYSEQRPGSLHKAFAGPELTEDGHLCDLIEGLAIGRIVVRLKPSEEGTHWQRTDKGIQLIGSERGFPYGLHWAYHQLSAPITRTE